MAATSNTSNTSGSIDPAQLDTPTVYRLLTSLVVPRPIAWVSTVAPDGTANLAPHSYFNIVSSAPPVVHWTSAGIKDSLRNVRSSGEFVINIVDEELLERMNTTAADFPAGIDEAQWAGIDMATSKVVRPGRVAQSPAALECRLLQELTIGNGNMVFGEVVNVWLRPDIGALDRILPEQLRAVGRMGGSAYTTTARPTRLERPTWADLQP